MPVGVQVEAAQVLLASAALAPACLDAAQPTTVCRVKHAQTHAPRSSTYLPQGPNERMHHKILELAVAALARRASEMQEHISRPRTHEQPDHATRAMVMRNSAP